MIQLLYVLLGTTLVSRHCLCLHQSLAYGIPYKLLLSANCCRHDFYLQLSNGRIGQRQRSKSLTLSIFASINLGRGKMNSSCELHFVVDLELCGESESH